MKPSNYLHKDWMVLSPECYSFIRDKVKTYWVRKYTDGLCDKLNSGWRPPNITNLDK